MGEGKYFEDRSRTLMDSIKDSWSINVFFQFGIAILYTVAVIKAISQRLFWGLRKLFVKKYRNITCSSKVSTNTLIERINKISDDNVLKSLFLMFFYWGLSACKLIYHTAIFAWWLWKNIIIPIGKALIVLLSVMVISRAVKNQNMSK